MAKTGSKLTNCSDAELIDIALGQDGRSDQMAFVILYQRYEAGVRAHIAKFTRQREDIEDICMETFQKAFSQLASYKKEFQFSTWIYRIAQNATFDFLSKQSRKDSRMPTTSIMLGEDENEVNRIPDDAVSPVDDIINREVNNKWMENIDRLKDGYREVARMYLIENYGYKEIAEELDMPLNTVRTKIRRAKALLEKMMETSDEID